MKKFEFDNPADDKYLSYLTEHRENVKKAYNWIKDNTDILSLIPEEEKRLWDIDEIIKYHDMSKYRTGTTPPYYELEDEFFPYADYFYGEDEQGNGLKEARKESFDVAWLHHQHTNPHHWQYWVLINDTDGVRFIDMPVTFIIEMLCNHWSFSFKSRNLREIFSWYNKNKDNMMLSSSTRIMYEDILNALKSALVEKGVIL